MYQDMQQIVATTTYIPDPDALIAEIRERYGSGGYLYVSAIEILDIVQRHVVKSNAQLLIDSRWQTNGIDFVAYSEKSVLHKLMNYVSETVIAGGVEIKHHTMDEIA